MDGYFRTRKLDACGHGIVDAVLAHAKRAGLIEAAIAKVEAPASSSRFHAIARRSSLPSYINASSSCLLTAPTSAFARSNWAVLCHRALRSRSFDSRSM